jgi:hypothetical protein
MIVAKSIRAAYYPNHHSIIIRLHKTLTDIILNDVEAEIRSANVVS